ncbi:histone-lysine N-methyltransferase ASHH3-like protein [Trifolium pratense]|uniref:Histone-lysine N-methyltransferase ASHH3-like protein n=1 Tax=Trifolium pratense TaxID=57577 RepID=A0A2K3P8B6_TRIPR|nr:histone-lysine N-methyltransferase ASHH3-like protein [Trifolium pratense]
MKKNSEQNRFGAVFNKLLSQIGEPVDFELPEWVKIRTTQYTHIKRNIYLTKKNKRKFDHGIFCSCEPSSESTGVCGRDCHCGMLLSSCSSACKCGISCLNKAFQNRPVKKMKLVKTEKCGSGIVADEDIKLGEFVIEYVGEVIDDKTCEQRLWNMKDRGETNFYLCEITRDMVIDATNKGNKSRYINHSCCPNTEMQKWIIDGETRIGIFATRDIQKGEHLTYDYQFVQFGADQDCHCGAVQCRRKLGARPTKPKVSSDAAVKLVAYQIDLLVCFALNCEILIWTVKGGEGVYWLCLTTYFKIIQPKKGELLVPICVTGANGVTNPRHGIREILMEMRQEAMQTQPY